MDIIYSKEDQFTANGKYIPMGQKHKQISYESGEHGYVVEDNDVFYKVNKRGYNYPYSRQMTYNPYNNKMRRPEHPSNTDLIRYKKDFNLLNNLNGTCNYHKFR